MTPYCSILLNPTTSSDVLTACIQAEAAAQAGLMQAAAAAQAGYWTFAAGAFAILAAVGGAWATLTATKRQIGAARDEQSRQRSHDLKSEVYVTAIRALSTGLLVLVRMANLDIRPQDVLIVYTEKMDDLFGVHLVAEVDTASKFLDCVQRLGAVHNELLSRRPWHPSPSYRDYQVDLRIEWSRECTAALKEVVPSMTLAVAAMRAELGMAVNPAEYEKLIFASMEKAFAGNERLFAKLLAG